MIKLTQKNLDTICDRIMDPKRTDYFWISPGFWKGYFKQPLLINRKRFPKQAGETIRKKLKRKKK